jgi:hypothetical protein
VSSGGKGGNPWIRDRSAPGAGVALERGRAAGPSPGVVAADALTSGAVTSDSPPSSLVPSGLSEAELSGDSGIGYGIPSWDVPPAPHLGGVEQTPSPQDVARAGWWWLGVHGGAGVNTLVSFLPGGLDAYRRWPAPQLHAGPGAVILVCRTHAYGLARARDAMSQWQVGDVPEGLLLAGLVAVADAPGKLPRRQAEVLRLLAGAVPRLWTVPWLDELRMAEEPEELPLPPPLVRLSLDLEALRHRFGSIW